MCWFECTKTINPKKRRWERRKNKSSGGKKNSARRKKPQTHSSVDGHNTGSVMMHQNAPLDVSAAPSDILRSSGTGDQVPAKASGSGSATNGGEQRVPVATVDGHHQESSHMAEQPQVYAYHGVIPALQVETRTSAPVWQGNEPSRGEEGREDAAEGSAGEDVYSEELMDGLVNAINRLLQP
jgi:hypothetical protein